MFGHSDSGTIWARYCDDFLEFEGRGSIYSEALTALRASFGRREPVFEGEHFSFSDFIIDPWQVAETRALVLHQDVELSRPRRNPLVHSNSCRRPHAFVPSILVSIHGPERKSSTGPGGLITDTTHPHHTSPRPSHIRSDVILYR